MRSNAAFKPVTHDMKEIIAAAYADRIAYKKM